jgi:hypothetical protein
MGKTINFSIEQIQNNPLNFNNGDGYCSLNSALQSLISLPIFQNYLFSIDVDKISNEKNKEIIENLQNLIFTVLKTKNTINKQEKSMMMKKIYACRELLWNKLTNNSNLNEDTEELLGKIIATVGECLQNKEDEDRFDATFGKSKIFYIAIGESRKSDIGSICRSDAGKHVFGDVFGGDFDSFSRPKVLILKPKSKTLYNGVKAVDEIKGCFDVDGYPNDYKLHSTVSYVRRINHYKVNIRENIEKNNFREIDSINSTEPLPVVIGADKLQDDNVLFIYVKEGCFNDVYTSVNVPKKIEERTQKQSVNNYYEIIGTIPPQIGQTQSTKEQVPLINGITQPNMQRINLQDAKVLKTLDIMKREEDKASEDMLRLQNAQSQQSSTKQQEPNNAEVIKMVRKAASEQERAKNGKLKNYKGKKEKTTYIMEHIIGKNLSEDSIATNIAAYIVEGNTSVNIN